MALTDNLNAYWKIDETSDGSGAVTRLDSTANNNDLTDNNTTASGTGIINNGADFERTNSERLTITDAAQTGLNPAADLSMQFWLKFEQLPSTAGGNMVLTSKWGAGDNREYSIISLSNDNLRFALSADGTGVAGKFHTSDSNADIVVAGDVGNWMHLIVTYDGSADTAVFYKNGSSVALTKLLSNTAGTIFNGAGLFGLASEFNGSEYFDGIMDEVGFWDRVLTADEVTELYNSGAGLAYPFTTEVFWETALV